MSRECRRAARESFGFARSGGRPRRERKRLSRHSVASRERLIAPGCTTACEALQAPTTRWWPWPRGRRAGEGEQSGGHEGQNGKMRDARTEHSVAAIDRRAERLG